MPGSAPITKRLLRIVGLGLWVAFGASAQAFEITPEQREACMGDALRLCGSEIPDLDRVLICMKAKRSQVSAHCKATIPKAVVRSL